MYDFPPRSVKAQNGGDHARNEANFDLAPKKAEKYGGHFFAGNKGDGKSGSFLHFLWILKSCYFLPDEMDFGYWLGRTDGLLGNFAAGQMRILGRGVPYK